MIGIPLTLTNVLQLLPVLTREQVTMLSGLCPGITCVVHEAHDHERFMLVAEVEGRAVVTRRHDRIGPHLVEELVGLVEQQVGGRR